MENVITKTKEAFTILRKTIILDPNVNNLSASSLTFGILLNGFHGEFPIHVKPVFLGVRVGPRRINELVVANGPPTLPQEHFVLQVHKNQTWENFINISIHNVVIFHLSKKRGQFS